MMQSTSDDAINGGTQIATPNANSTYSAEPNRFRTAGKTSHPHHGEDGAGLGKEKSPQWFAVKPPRFCCGLGDQFGGSVARISNYWKYLGTRTRAALSAHMFG
jgi:hypothetical protein